MVLIIKNAETERLARELARRRKKGLTEVVTEALRKEVERERRRPQRPDREAFLRAVREIGERGSLYPEIDARSDEDILGYCDMLDAPAGQPAGHERR
ncbi:MAG: type II toxin-antitoxin system VapB family antitoxin [Pseudomonadota bacterium]